MLLQKRNTIILNEVDNGAYDALLDRMYYNENYNNLKLKLCIIVNINGEDTEVIIYITLFIKSKNGNSNPITENHISDLLTITQLEEIPNKDGYFPDLDNREIGVLVQMSEYNGYRNIELVKFYDTETGKTAYELENDLPATWLDKKLDEMEN